MASRRLFALLAPSGVLVIAWALQRVEARAAIPWLVGVGLGLALQRSRFCIAAAYRDALLFHDTGITRAVLLALSLTTLGFAAIQYQAGGALPPGQLQPVSLGTLVGALLFGIGIVPAGGCACSTLLRLGEGHLRFLWTALGLVVGSLLGASHYAWWEGAAGSLPPVHLPALLGWPGALLLQAALLSALFWLALRWERRGAAAP
ncbi:MAG: YeeE/YedE thiosulfate transporter family protein [Bacillota bacterium]